MAQAVFRCKVLTQGETEGRTVLAMGEGMTGPLIKGDGGGLDFQCGSCGKVIASGVEVHTFTDIVIRCTCGANNETNLV